MPLKTTIGFCEKRGQPDYGSLGASCHVEFELELVHVQQDPAVFHQQVRAAFADCRQAVAEELARHTRPPATATPGSPAPATNGNGQSHQPGNRQAPKMPSGASEKQLAYLRRLASQIPELGLEKLNEVAHCVCGEMVAALSTAEASRLIDMLKAAKAGEVDLNELITGVTA